jgi:ABC-2 type transport system ATP-binding protein
MMIQIWGLRKAFATHVVLDGIDLQVADGTICALLGPNGAGKTTLVQILSTLLPADGGQARVAGYDVRTQGALVRAAIGVTGQFSAVDSLLTGEANLLSMADLHHLNRSAGRQRVAGLLARFELGEVARRTPATY